MRGYQALAMMLIGMSLAACTSDPTAPVNQAFPIRQMDQFFGSLSAPPPPARQAYTHEPGYAPAYPSY